MRSIDLKSGDLLYWKGKGFFSWLVRWATRPSFWRFWTTAPYSHVAVCWKNGSMPTQFVESYPGIGVRVVRMMDDPPDFAQHTHTAWLTNVVVERINPLMGRPYSRWTALMVMLGMSGDGTSAFMCSELAQYLLEQFGWDWKGEKYHPYGLSLAVTRANPEFTVEPLEV